MSLLFPCFYVYDVLWLWIATATTTRTTSTQSGGLAFPLFFPRPQVKELGWVLEIMRAEYGDGDSALSR